MLVMEWPEIARLQCTADGRRARVTRFPNAHPGSFAKLRGPMRALLGDLRGGLGLHASAVAIGRGAVLLVGDSGAGKSTTACELARDHGGRLLADDAALVVVRRGRALVEPTEASHCLWLDTSRQLGVTPKRGARYHEKVFVRPTRVAHAATRVALVVALRFDDALAKPVTRDCSGMAAAGHLLGSMFRVKEGAVEARRLDLVQWLHDHVSFVEVSRPRSVPSAAEEIATLLRRAT